MEKFPCWDIDPSLVLFRDFLTHIINSVKLIAITSPLIDPVVDEHQSHVPTEVDQPIVEEYSSVQKVPGSVSAS